MSVTNIKNFFNKERSENTIEMDFLNSELPFIEFEETEQVRIKQYNEFRADLISYEAYDTTELWWLILIANNIIDPFEELYEGRIIDIPSLSEYYKFYNKYAKRKRD